jgi:hypothetical protein
VLFLGKYSITDELYQNNHLVKKINYKSSKERNERRIKKTTNYSYDNSGNLKLKTGFDGKGGIIDSSRYFYNGSKITSIAKYHQTTRDIIYYTYQENNVKNIILINNNCKVEIEYEFTSQNKISSISFSKKDSGFNTSKKYFFEYNSDGKLTSINVYLIGVDTENLIFKDQYIFNYYDNKILKSVSLANERGKISKEINYDVNYLDVK